MLAWINYCVHELLYVLQVKHIVPSIHVIYVIVAHGMERLTKSLGSEGLLIPTINGHDFENLTFGKSNPLRIVFVSVMSNFNWISVHQDELIELTSFQRIIWIEVDSLRKDVKKNFRNLFKIELWLNESNF